MEVLGLGIKVFLSPVSHAQNKDLLFETVEINNALSTETMLCSQYFILSASHFWRRLSLSCFSFGPQWIDNES